MSAHKVTPPQLPLGLDMGMSGMPTNPDELAKGIRMMSGKGSPQPTPEQQKYINLIKTLTEQSISMVIKVATCTCEKKDSCTVFKEAQGIARIIDELQSASPPVPRVIKKIGKNRR